MKRVTLLLCLTILFSGCIPVSNFKHTPDKYADNVGVKRDDAKKITTIFGQKLPLPLSGYTQLKAIHADGSKKPLIVITTREVYNGERYNFDHAYDSHGKRLKVISVDSDVNCTSNSLGCEYSEWINITLDLDYVKQNQNTGITYRLYGNRGGHNKRYLPPDYVRGFLIALKNNLQITF